MCVYLASLGGSLDPLLEHGQVLVRQVPDHLVQLLPLLQVGVSTTDIQWQDSIIARHILALYTLV